MFSGHNPLKYGIVVSVVAAALMVSPATTIAQDEIAPINTGNWSFDLGSDIVTAYWFRGLSQGSINRQGVILQPFMQATVDLWSRNEWSLAGTVGTWNSLTTAQNGGGGWYESDLLAGVTIGMPANLEMGITYALLYNPSGGAEFAQEIDLELSYDDSGYWKAAGIEAEGFNGLQPYVLLVTEVSGASDGIGSGSAWYLELGITPTLLVCPNEDYPITMAVPVKIGLSLDDYYETTATSGSDTFGFGSVGVDLSMPLAAIVPAQFGAWTVHAGVDALFLNSDLRTISTAAGTGSDNVQIVGKVGASMSY
jgi:hypothetical protein